MKRLSAAAVLFLCLTALPGAVVQAAAEKWFEIKSSNFTVWANANNGSTRTLIWQLEQMRNVARNLWPWMNVDLPKPLVIIALRDEQSMKNVAPQYWETKGGARPGSVWVSAPDHHYIAIRTDLEQRDDVMVNPHTSAYFSYANMVFASSFATPLPMWLSRGMSGVVSNTLVRANDVVIGAAIPWHLERLRERRLPMRQLLVTTRSSPVFRSDEGQRDFDAQSWAFVHYLMFSERGMHAAKLNAFVAAIGRGEPPETAFGAAIGNIDDYELAFSSYVNRNLYSAVRIKADMGIDRERFPVRQMSPAEGMLAQAGFHVAMRRTVEAGALLNEAAKSDPGSPAIKVLEALMLEQAGNADGAKAAYARAVELGTTSAYALYRSAMLAWRGADEPALESIEKHLARAVELDPRFAAAHASLAEVRAVRKGPQSTIVPHMQKAVALEPSNPWHRLIAARVLARLNAVAEARKAVESAVAIGDDDPRVGTEAARILASLGKS
jgi:tetratricopeptide (TPR) repeat protein